MGSDKQQPGGQPPHGPHWAEGIKLFVSMRNCDVKYQKVLHTLRWIPAKLSCSATRWVLWATKQEKRMLLRHTGNCATADAFLLHVTSLMNQSIHCCV